MNSLVVILLLLSLDSVCFGQDSQVAVLSPNTQYNVTIPVVWDLTSPPHAAGLTLFEWAIEDLTAQGHLTDVTVEFSYAWTNYSVANSVNATIAFVQNQKASLIIGNFFSNILVSTGVVGKVYGTAQLSVTATASELSDKSMYPDVSRLTPPDTSQTGALVAFLAYYNTNYPTFGYNKIAIIMTSDALGMSLYNSFMEKLPRSIEVHSTQTLLTDQTDMTLELQTIKTSGSRVIVSLVTQTVIRNLVTQANEMGITGKNYVWLVSDLFAASRFYVNFTTGEYRPEYSEPMRGFIGTSIYVSREGPYADLMQHYLENPVLSLGTPSSTTILGYDTGLLLGRAIQTAKEQGLLDQDHISPATWSSLLRSTTFEGASGNITLDKNGDRIGDYWLMNFVPDQYNSTNFGWENAVLWRAEDNSLEFKREIVWPGNTTKVPDLDIRPPFRYWSCHDGELEWDYTGKTVKREKPDGDDVDAIDSNYYCDGFIDCKNLSDESWSCETNYEALFIVFGIITCILILIALLFIPFTLIFGCCIRRKRVTAASPLFLLMIIVSVIVGYCSTFAWYGKPHPVACGFQPWLLGLSVVSLIAGLSAKTFRIWRIFKTPFTRVVISDVELVVLWALIMIPAVIILALWTLISTPTADLEEREDAEHYICATGGFTGAPGGYIFFGIFVGYLAVVIGFALFLSVVTRKVPSLFNESRLIAISIFHITLLGITIIPTVIVLQYFDPFGAWIVRTMAILYGFTATLWLQFLPQLIGMIVIDRCKDTKIKRGSLKSFHSSSGSGQQKNSMTLSD